MQITRLHIEHFKGVKSLDIDFLDELTGEPRPFTLLLGDNGSGKTTVLQAIALTLSLATHKTEEPDKLEWPGFLAERLGSGGKTRVELGVRFTADELSRTRELHLAFRKAKPTKLPVPGQSQDVNLVFADGTLNAVEGEEAISQFLGRHFIKSLIQTQPAHRRSFPRVGDVFWFDQNRNLDRLGEGKEVGIERLRGFLVSWWAFHKSPGVTPDTDYLARLEKPFRTLFPGTSFEGVAPRDIGRAPSAENAYFLLKNGERTYDLAEMSSGEQAVFPLLYEFVRQSIAQSVVLIDELELHLHPPQQQKLVSSLAGLGQGCQFIVTTHSPFLEQVTPNEQEVRLPGGHPCL